MACKDYHWGKISAIDLPAAVLDSITPGRAPPNSNKIGPFKSFQTFKRFASFKTLTD
jgi:hypothetical protein